MFYKINCKEVNWIFGDNFLLELYYLEANLFIMTVMHRIFVVYNFLGIFCADVLLFYCAGLCEGKDKSQISAIY